MDGQFRGSPEAHRADAKVHWMSSWPRWVVSTPWTTGDALAAGVVVTLVVLTLLGTLIHVGSIGAGHIAWAWGIAGGDSGDSTQASMARAAWAGVIVGAVTIVFLGLTLALTGRSTRIALLATQQALLLGRKEMRAYVSITGLTITVVGWGTDRFFYRPPKIEVGLKNTGQTPAKSMRMLLGWQNHPPEPFPKLNRLTLHSAYDIGAGITIEENVPCDDFVENALAAAVHGDMPSWAFGVVEYEDVFGDTWRTYFQREIRFKPTGKDLTVSVIVPGAGNSST